MPSLCLRRSANSACSVRSKDSTLSRNWSYSAARIVLRNVTAAGRTESLLRSRLTLASLNSPSGSPSSVSTVLVMAAGPRPAFDELQPCCAPLRQAHPQLQERAHGNAIVPPRRPSLVNGDGKGHHGDDRGADCNDDTRVHQGGLLMDGTTGRPGGSPSAYTPER